LLILDLYLKVLLKPSGGYPIVPFSFKEKFLQMAPRKKSKTKPFKKQIGFYLEPSLHKSVTDKARKTDRKMSEVIRMLLRKWDSGELDI